MLNGRLVDENNEGPEVSCQGCEKTSAWNTHNIVHHYWARNDFNGFFTGVYCDPCYEDPSKYPYRKDNYNQDAIENGEDIWGEE